MISNKSGIKKIPNPNTSLNSYVSSIRPGMAFGVVIDNHLHIFREYHDLSKEDKLRNVAKCPKRYFNIKYNSVRGWKVSKGKLVLDLHKRPKKVFYKSNKSFKLGDGI